MYLRVAPPGAIPCGKGFFELERSGVPNADAAEVTAKMPSAYCMERYQEVIRRALAADASLLGKAAAMLEMRTGYTIDGHAAQASGKWRVPFTAYIFDAGMLKA